MIISKEKDFQIIKQYLEGYKKVAIIGCGACAAACQTGGDEDVERMAKKLEPEHEIILKTTVDESCHHLLTRKQLKPYQKALKDSDCILAMSCGAGVQSLSALFFDKKILPANDTHGLGNVIRAGQFKNYCSLCGECILEETEGICIKTRCPKNQVNGPCGGMVEGKCEVFPDKDCVFVMIYRKKKELKLPERKKKVMKKDFSKKIVELELPRKR